VSTYSNYALRGVIAGLVTGVITSVIYLLLILPIMTELVEVIVHLRIPQNIPTKELKELISNIEGMINNLTPIVPITQIIQQLILGSLFGVLQGFLTLRLKLKELNSALITGLTYMFILNLIPLILIQNLTPELMELLVKHLGFNTYLILTSPGITFTVSLIILSISKKFWSKLMTPKQF